QTNFNEGGPRAHISYPNSVAQVPRPFVLFVLDSKLRWSSYDFDRWPEEIDFLGEARSSVAVDGFNVKHDLFTNQSGLQRLGLKDEADVTVHHEVRVFDTSVFEHMPLTLIDIIDFLDLNCCGAFYTDLESSRLVPVYVSRKVIALDTTIGHVQGFQPTVSHSPCLVYR